jgi:hypothetical protein
MKFAPAIQRGIFLTIDDSREGSNFVVAVAMRNPSDEDVSHHTSELVGLSVDATHRTSTIRKDFLPWVSRLAVVCRP